MYFILLPGGGNYRHMGGFPSYDLHAVPDVFGSVA